MSLKPRNINPSTVTRNLQEVAAPTGNVYESIAIISRRANQISASVKEELGVRLRDFNVVSDSLEEIFENREQIEISKYYERMAKPSLMAIDEFMTGELKWNHKELPEAE
jgi:DNA-directed RNA polymerase subunit K/omega